MLRDDLVTFLKSLDGEDLRFILDKVGESGKPLSPAATFEVPPEVKHLDQVRLSLLTEAFREWARSAKGMARKRSRNRVWMLFLLIRYGALKLSEATAVDPRTDFDFAASTVRAGGPAGRVVQLPGEAAAELRGLLSDPLLCAPGGQVFKIDHGYVRRAFYGRADACGIPRDMVNARVLRHSRAIELLRQGLPLGVVRSLLGHQNLGFTAQYVNFSEEDVRRIVSFLILKEAKMKTSARNAFTGKVTAVRASGNLAEIEVKTPAGLSVVSVITMGSLTGLGLKPGSLVTATVKAPWVILVKDEDGLKSSAGNSFRGQVVQISPGDISTEVVVELPEGTKVCALITDESAKILQLAVGEPVRAEFTAFSVILNVE